MRNFAGLNLNPGLFKLYTSENYLPELQLLMHRAYRDRYERFPDYSANTQLILNLARYVRQNLLPVYELAGGDKHLDYADLQAAIALRFIPADIALDVKLSSGPAISIMQRFKTITLSLPEQERINGLLTEPVSSAALEELEEVMAEHRETLNQQLNLENKDWRETAATLFSIVSQANLANAYSGLNKIKEMDQSRHVPPQNLPYIIALQILMYCEILRYINHRRGTMSYKIRTEMSCINLPQLDIFARTVQQLLHAALIKLNELPEESDITYFSQIRYLFNNIRTDRRVHPVNAPQPPRRRYNGY